MSIIRSTSEPGDFPESVKEQARKLAGFRCCLCRQNIGDHAHHLTPKSEGGSNELDNAILLCTRCHDLYGHRQDWRVRLRQARDDWYQMVPELFAPKVLKRLELLDTLATKQDIKELKIEFASLVDIMKSSIQADSTGPREVANAASTMVTSIATAPQMPQYRYCFKCGLNIVSQIPEYSLTACPNCGAEL